MSNHLIIGLGGTGGKIIRSFRKTIFQEFRKERPEQVAIDYLYVDSDASMMESNDPTWKILGNNVQLGKKNQLLIEGTNLEVVLNNINNFPGMKEWIGDRTQWKHILDSIGSAKILGGQKRRLGRFLFANKVDQFNKQVKDLVLGLHHRGDSTAAVTFHVCCGLAGGTGSGSLVDVIAQIRENYPDPNIYQILVYALLPDEYPPLNWNTGNYWANGYATLMELNALSVRRFKPCDITGQKQRLSPQDVFNGCYVFTNKNENGVPVEVDKELPNVVADFLYMKIVASQYAGEWNQKLQRIEKFENLDSTPEMASGGNMPERSRKFLTFGIKRLAVPEEEIHEYLTFSFANQTSLHFLYNHWQDGVGYIDQPKNRAFHHEVQQRDLLQRWKLTNAHFCLSEGILESDNLQNWKPIQEEWQSFIPNVKQFIRENCEKNVWLDELKKICYKRFEQNYRGGGVSNFYNQRLRDKTRLANEICRGIEQDLFTDWQNRTYSMEDIDTLLKALTSATEERLAEIDRRIRTLGERKEEIEERITSIDREWARVGLLGDVIFGKRNQLFDAQATNLQDLLICHTWIEGWKFAKEFLPELINALTDLNNEVNQCLHTIQQASSEFQQNMAARINDDRQSEQMMKKNLVRFYEPDAVRRLNERFKRDQEEQRNQIKQVRDALIGKMGANPSFKKFNETISISAFVDTLAAECEAFVKRYHDTHLNENTQEKLLGANIIEKLGDEYGGNVEELRSYMEKLVRYAGNYIGFSDSERQRQESGIPSGATCISNFTIIMPRSTEHEDFMRILEDALERSRQLGVDIVHADHRPNEITMISITNLFPLRFLDHLKFLEDKYDQRINSSDAERLKLELHLEGDGTSHPDLFVPPQVEIEKRGIPYFLLAKHIGLIQREQNEVTGRIEYLLKTKDEYGIDNEPIPLGKTINDVPDHLDSKNVNVLETEVKKVLMKEYLHVDKQNDLIDDIREYIEDLKDELGPNNDVFKRFRDGAKTAATLVTTEK